ncbi:MAG: hypothetical protein ACPLKS_07205 [Caldisericum exile]
MGPFSDGIVDLKSFAERIATIIPRAYNEKTMSPCFSLKNMLVKII